MNCGKPLRWNSDFTAKENIKNRAQNALKLYDEDILEIQQNQNNMQLIDEVSLNIIN